MVSAFLKQKPFNSTQIPNRMIPDYVKWLNEEPLLTAPAPDGGLHIPIEAIETTLDDFNAWGTQNFNFYMYRNGYADNCVAASIEVFVEYESDGVHKKRTFVGACNFSIKSLFPNQHWLATAKSMCIKNAVSDIGKKFGRGLNAEVMPSEEKKTEANEGVQFVNAIDELEKDGYVSKGKNLKNKNS
jgi:hypothetical protein